MTAALVLAGFGLGFGLRGILDAGRYRRRRGGYMRVPIASLHPREPKS
jgi:hypothetical protein